MDNLKDDLKGQGHRSKVKVTRSENLYFTSYLTFSCNVGGQRSHGSGSKVTWVKMKGPMGQDKQ